MSRNILVRGLLVAGLALAGCSSSSKSGTGGDGAVGRPDLPGQMASGDVPGAGGAGGDAGAGSSPGNGDAMTEIDGSARGDGARAGDAKVGQPGDVAGGTGGTGGGDGGPGLPRDAREATDQIQPQNPPDGAPGLGDATIGQDVAQQTDGLPAADVKPTTDGPSDTTRRDGPKDTGYCNLPDYGLSMPAEQKDIVEKYAACQYSSGKSYTDKYGETVLRGTLLQLREAKRCVDASDPQKGQTTGSSYRLVLGTHGSSAPDVIEANTSRTQRIYALKVAVDGTEARAAYDLVSSTSPGGMAPDYPERYARLDLVCGDASDFPEFDGWTGRMATQTYNTYYLVGSAKGESGERALYFEATVLPP